MGVISKPEVAVVAPHVGEQPARHSRRGAYATRDLTTGSIPRNLWFLAWPQVVEQVLSITDHLADLVWAGHIGATAIAGLGVAQSYTQLAMTGRMGFDTAMRAMVGRCVGAGDVRSANHVALQGFTLSGTVALLLMVIGVTLTEPLMRLLGVSDGVIAAGADYLRVQFVGQAAMAFRMMSGAALQASGDTLTPMKASTLARVLHIALSPCLVFGLLFFPEWGLAGAAAANAFAQLIGVAMNFRALFSGGSRLHLTVRGYRPDPALLWRIARLGAPAAVTSMERSVAQVMLIGIVAPFGDFTLAAYSLTRRTEQLAHMGMRGLGQAAGIMTAQNLGAGKPARARSAVRWALGFGALSLVGTGVLLYVFAEPVLTLFNDQPELLSVAAAWLRIQVIGNLFMGLAAILTDSFNSAGDTTAPMLVALLAIWCVQQPLALFLPGVWGLGAYGIAWAINVASFVRIAVYLPYFAWAPWMKKRVLAAPKAPAAAA